MISLISIDSTISVKHLWLSADKTSYTEIAGEQKSSNSYKNTVLN